MQYWRSELCSLLDIASKHKYWSLSLYQDQGNRQDMSKVYRKITEASYTWGIGFGATNGKPLCMSILTLF